MREQAPSAASARVVGLDLFCAASTGKTPELRYVLSRPAKTRPETLWEWKLKAELDDPQTIAKLAEQAEALSRGELKAVLARTAALKPVSAARQSAIVPSEAEKGLWEFNELAVFNSLRRIHAEIRKHGESPELLAALAVGYANLGSLTAYYFSPAQKVHFARALLYAERLLHETGGSGWALWHRAYVRTLVGLHHLAELDVAAAKERQAKSPAKQALPFWTGAIEAFSQGRLPQMVEQAKTPEGRRLALYLNLEGVASCGIASVTRKAADALVAECPDCFRGWDAMHLPGQPSKRRFVNSFPLLSRTLRDRLPKIEGLPESIATRVKEARNFDAEIKFRADLFAQLTDDSSSAADAEEPSLAALAHTIQEIEVAQLVRDIQVGGARQGRFDRRHDRPKTASVRAPSSCRLHRHFRTKRRAPSRSGDQDGPVARYEPRSVTTRRSLSDRCTEKTRPTLRRGSRSPAPTPIPCLPTKCSASGRAPPATRPSRRPTPATWTCCGRPARSCRPPSPPGSPTTGDTPSARRPHSKRILGRFPRDDGPHIPVSGSQTTPGRRAVCPAAGRTCSQLVHVRHVGDGRQTAGRHGPLGGDGQGALSKGFDRIRLCNQLARLYMDRKNWKDASLYADQAVQYAQPALISTRPRPCGPRLGATKCSASGKNPKRSCRPCPSTRAPLGHEWMLWCYRTGHGDVEAADEFARKYFESIGGDAPPSTLTKIGAYYLLKKEREKALVVFGKAFDDGHETYAAMHAALIADSLGKVDQRDSYLKKIIEDGKKAKPTSVAGVYGQLAAWMQKALSPSGVRDFDFKEADRILRPSKERPRPGVANLAYFVGAFLKNCGKTDKAGEYFLRCARTQNYQFFNYVLACQALRDLKIPVPAATNPEAIQESEGEDASKSATR